jgi:hypothetical protein
VNHERKFGCEHPPFAGKGQKATLHFGQRDISTRTDLAYVFIQASAQCARLLLVVPFEALPM